jgi:hypothetical protein
MVDLIFTSLFSIDASRIYFDDDHVPSSPSLSTIAIRNVNQYFFSNDFIFTGI